MVFSIRPEIQSLLQEVEVFALAKKVRLFIVGGFLRDFFLRRTKENPDIDFCLARGGIAFGRQLAMHLHAGYVVLDAKNKSCRVVKKKKKQIITLDFTDFRGKDLATDILHRDFTMNTLAVGLSDVLSKSFSPKILIDRLDAQADMRRKIVRMANPLSFDEDPLRIIRAFSMSAIFGFTIEKKTVQAIKKKKKLLTGVSYERIRDELFKILDSPKSYWYIKQLDDAGILSVILPELDCMRKVAQGPYHHLDVWKHSLESLKQFDLLCAKVSQDHPMKEYLGQAVSGDHKRRALIALAMLLHDIGKPGTKRRRDGKTVFRGHERLGRDITKEIARKFKLSNDETNALCGMVFWHLRPGYLGDFKKVTPRAAFRYFRDTADEAAGTLLLSLADQRATRGPLTTDESRLQHERICSGLIKEFFRRKNAVELSRLLNGDEVMKIFKLQPSELVGKVLRHVAELQAIGKIKTKEQAIEASRKVVRQKQGLS